MGDKKFVKGLYAKVVTATWGDITKLSVDIDGFIEYLKALPEEDITVSDNGRRYFKADILKARNKGSDGKDAYYVSVDNWKPSARKDADPFD